MARRARDLVRAGMIRSPRKILVVTFSNRAKDNLKHRMSRTLGPNFDQYVTVTNFHGLGLRLLTNHGNVIGQTIDDTRHPLRGSLRRLRNQICAEYDTNQIELGKVLRWAKSGAYTDDDVLERLASRSAAARACVTRSGCSQKGPRPAPRWGILCTSMWTATAAARWLSCRLNFNKL